MLKEKQYIYGDIFRTNYMDMDQYDLQELPGIGMDYNADNVFELNDINLSNFLVEAAMNFSNNPSMSVASNMNGNISNMDSST